MGKQTRGSHDEFVEVEVGLVSELSTSTKAKSCQEVSPQSNSLSMLAGRLCRPSSNVEFESRTLVETGKWSSTITIASNMLENLVNMLYYL